MKILREIALRYPEAQMEVANEGTEDERGTVAARGRAFLFFGRDDVTLKVARSVGEATRLSHKDPRHFRLGAHGWVKATFQAGEPLPVELLAKWVDESYRLVAPRDLVDLLPESGPPPQANKAGSSP